MKCERGSKIESFLTIALLVAGTLVITTCTSAKTVVVNGDEFVLPFKLEQAELYADGGSMDFHLKDKNGKSLRFCVDHCLYTVKDGLAEEGPTSGKLFIGASHPSEDSAKLVEDETLEAQLKKLLKQTLPADSSRERKYQIVKDFLQSSDPE